MVPQYESPVRILGKEAVTGQQSVERDDLGQEAKQALGAVFTQKTDQHLDFRSSSFQLVQGKHLSDKARGQILIHQELAKKNKLERSEIPWPYPASDGGDSRQRANL